jgi:alpha-L-rhamnosidase
MRVTIDRNPFLPINLERPWRERGFWPCAWIACPGVGDPPFVTAYRRRFSLDRDATIRIHVTADERYELFLDGKRIGQGSERGAPDVWFYETYDLCLAVGEHVLVARVWSLGEQAASAQMSVHPGFLLAAEGEWIDVLGTGVAAWEAKRVDGYAFLDPSPAHLREARVRIDGHSYPWGVEHGEGKDWQPAQVLKPGLGRLVDWDFYRQHLLRPATLPPMMMQSRAAGAVRLVADVPSDETRPIPVRAADGLADEVDAWQALVEERGEVVLLPHTRRRVLIDLEDYCCAYPVLEVSGGAGSAVRVSWTEALVYKPELWHLNKGNRNEIEGKYFVGIGDEFLLDGGTRRRFSTLWWQAGRYVELVVETADSPLTLHRFTLIETRYPLEMESQFQTSDPRLTHILPILIRGMQMCAHETYYDCPYYEELMYAGDTRLEVLTTYVMTRDDRLPRKALRMFDASRLPSGLTQSRYPCRVMQIIAPFSLWWVAMVRDYALWRDDRAFVESLMPGVRATVEGYRRFMSVEKDGLLYSPEGWNVMDWVQAWEGGIPPGGVSGASGLLNWQYIYVLTLVADLEARLGEQELAARLQRHAAELAECATATFWDESRGLLADDVAKRHFSEHTQCMALLSDQLDSTRRARVANGLVHDSNLDRTTFYFSHYLFETYRTLGRIDALMERMLLWFELKQQGLKTTIERPEPTRSDCHAWGAHPLYHYFATILGIRPASLGFRTIEIAPQLGPLTSAEGRLVHPAGGEIVVKFYIKNETLHGSVSLPAGLTGTLCIAGQTIPLEGLQEF